MAGRPTEYKEEYNEQVYKLCLLGAIDKEIADFFGVEEKTLNNWKIKHPEFLQSIKEGKEKADAEVAKSLYKRATGYKKKSIQFATFRGEITDREEYIEDIPPDTTAAIFWLKNRKADVWREKQEIATTIKSYSLFEEETENKAETLESEQQSKKTNKK